VYSLQELRILQTLLQAREELRSLFKEVEQRIDTASNSIGLLLTISGGNCCGRLPQRQMTAVASADGNSKQQPQSRFFRVRLREP